MAPVKDIQKGISVVMCCYNSAQRLYETLKHLALQKTNDLFPWEIIIVDNASTDNTAAAAKQTWEGFTKENIPFKVIKEEKQGLSFARQRGVDEAGYEYVIFCDDDNWLAENYLLTAYRIIDEDISIGAAGGTSTAVSDTVTPGWFARYEEAYAVGKQAASTGYINDKGYVNGAGMVTRRSVFKNTVNKKLPVILTDRKGNTLSTGGDVEYCQRLLLQGYNLYYTEELVFQHFVPAFRLTEEYRNALLKGVEEVQWILREYFEAAKIKRANTYDKAKLIIAAVKDFSKSFLRRRKPHINSVKLFFYLFNVGFKNRNELVIIKHFYNCRNKNFSKFLKG